MAGKWGTFRGRRWWYEKKLRQHLDDVGRIQIAVKSVGWDRRYAQIAAIPRTTQTMLRSAIRDNAEMVADKAREYVPQGLETDDLLKSIKAVGVNVVGAHGVMSTVQADTPYAHFVEMDVHPSYGKKFLPSGVDYNWPIKNPGITVFGARQGPPQGPHFMQRAAEDTEQQSHLNIKRAIQKAITHAMATAKAGYNVGRMDFDTRVSRNAYAFAHSAAKAVGTFENTARRYGETLHPLDMEVRGL